MYIKDSMFKLLRQRRQNFENMYKFSLVIFLIIVIAGCITGCVRKNNEKDKSITVGAAVQDEVSTETNTTELPTFDAYHSTETETTVVETEETTVAETEETTSEVEENDAEPDPGVY